MAAGKPRRRRKKTSGERRKEREAETKEQELKDEAFLPRQKLETTAVGGDHVPVFRPIRDIGRLAEAIRNQGNSHEPNPDSRQLVSNMVACGIKDATIAKVFGMSPKKLKEMFADEIETAGAVANAQVGAGLFQTALDPTTKSGVIAAIFWLKARGGWRETGQPQGDEDYDDVDVEQAKKQLLSQVKDKIDKDSKEDDDDTPGAQGT